MLAAGVLGLAVLGALLSGSPGGAPGSGVSAVPVADHVHVVHRGISAAALPRPLAPLASLVVPRRRVHVLDPRTALNLVTAHETRRRRGSKRPPPYHRGRGPPRGPPRPPRYKGSPSKRKAGPRGKPWTQATRGSSPAPTRVRYSKAPRKKAKSKKHAKKREPQLPAYADGYADDEDLVELQNEAEDPDVEEDRPRKRPAKSSGSAKQQHGSSYPPKGWGPDGGYRVPAPQYPPYGTDEDEPGTGHLDLEERFINQHNQFYRHGYPAESAESAPMATQSKRHRPGLAPVGLYEDEEIEVAEATDDFGDGGLAATTSHNTRQQSYRRPSKTTRYQLQHDGGEADEGSPEEDEYRRPYGGGSSSKGRGKKKQDSRRHQSMYHAKFREHQDDRTLSAANFNYELTGAASETAQSAVDNNNNSQKSNYKNKINYTGNTSNYGTVGGSSNNYGTGTGSSNNYGTSSNGNSYGTSSTSNNHRPAHETGEVGITDVRTVDTNFFRTRKPQYWG
ncbi:uncharacterized protein LOC113216679 [Frankliniella occidentalis]|uniref:Uncharacterized protein LOC113216679 n=1 Tax=Frankliniella occidentalis TaxID=133901 RepID=A0A6J1TN57_FRAOC|nr:uncharacterized protein LOC113216679 [Frankliniella occidentalis]